MNSLLTAHSIPGKQREKCVPVSGAVELESLPVNQGRGRVRASR